MSNYPVKRISLVQDITGSNAMESCATCDRLGGNPATWQPRAAQMNDRNWTLHDSRPSVQELWQPAGYGQPYAQFAQPQMGQPQIGQPNVGQPQFGQPQPGQPQFGQPQFAQAGQPQLIQAQVVLPHLQPQVVQHLQGYAMQPYVQEAQLAGKNWYQQPSVVEMNVPPATKKISLASDGAGGTSLVFIPHDDFSRSAQLTRASNNRELPPAVADALRNRQVEKCTPRRSQGPVRKWFNNVGNWMKSMN